MRYVSNSSRAWVAAKLSSLGITRMGKRLRKAYNPVVPETAECDEPTTASHYLGSRTPTRNVRTSPDARARMESGMDRGEFAFWSSASSPHPLGRLPRLVGPKQCCVRNRNRSTSARGSRLPEVQGHCNHDHGAPRLIDVTEQLPALFNRADS